MQVKKAEIRLEILNAAESEFYIRGYHSASMRTIAKKANTTLGNIYNYFENKDALFDAVIGHIPEAIEDFISFHRSVSIKNLSRYNYPALLKDALPNAFPLDLMLSKPFIIFLEGSDKTKYETIRDTLLKNFSDHICDHLQLETDSTLVKAIFNGYISTFISIAKNGKSLESQKSDLFNFVINTFFGMPDANHQK